MEKQEIRQKIWTLLQDQKVARFPGAKGRIPNFRGSESCASGFAQLDVWKKAHVIKANPDSPQRAIRHLALKEGKIVYMAVPRLRDEKCFIELDPAKLGKKLYVASSIKGAFELGTLVGPEKMRPIDLVLCGTVAARKDGARIGKGGGYSDLEYAIGRELGLITARTPIVTSVHRLQLIDYKIELMPHDIPVDAIVTPEQVITCKGDLRRPKGILWEYLDEEKISSIPILQKMRKTSKGVPH